MLFLSGFELHSRWVPLISRSAAYAIKLGTAFDATENRRYTPPKHFTPYTERPASSSSTLFKRILIC